MQNAATEPELSSLLERYEAAGGVLNYVFLEPNAAEPPDTWHRAAALAGMAEIDRRLEQWAVRNASDQYPIGMFFRVHWDETKLTGEPVSFSTFWGTDDAEPKPITDHSWSIPPVDG